jgi:hypothetical protein
LVPFGARGARVESFDTAAWRFSSKYVIAPSIEGCIATLVDFLRQAAATFAGVIDGHYPVAIRSTFHWRRPPPTAPSPLGRSAASSSSYREDYPGHHFARSFGILESKKPPRSRTRSPHGVAAPSTQGRHRRGSSLGRGTEGR